MLKSASRSRLNFWRCFCFDKSSQYSIIVRGSPNTESYRIYLKNKSGPLSYMHDIPLQAGKNIFNMVVEMPRWTNAKMEIRWKEPLTPIAQDVKNGKLRYINNVFPHHGCIFNYGALPQTFEDPKEVDKNTNCVGDKDPIDFCELGDRVARSGEVIQVKVLGCLALLDEGETDYKLLGIDVKDPLASKLNSIKDIQTLKPGYLPKIIDYFKIYKVPSGKPENVFAFNGEAKDRDFALEVIKKVHETWKNMINRKVIFEDVDCSTVKNKKSPFKIKYKDSLRIVSKTKKPGLPAPRDDIVDKWYFVKRSEENNKLFA